ncbi:MAG: amidohydrolase family protein, partial [Thermodesulfobacteriota bacterium]|nr:amidohydrolase family protein [Thermodesulfobacteriota bacterium]
MTPPQKPLSSVRETSLPETIVFKTKRAYILTADRVWVEPGKILQPGWLLIENGRIVAAGSGRPLSAADAELIDLGPVLVTPGLIDAHVHLDLDPGQGLDLAGRVFSAASYGLAAVRDGGDNKALVLSSKDLIQRKLLVSASGRALYSPGRYGAFLGRPVAGPREMAQAVRETARCGADQIKILASGPVGLDKFGMVGPPQFSAEDLQYLVTLAQNEGLGVMAHANGAKAVIMCLRAGVDSIEHGYFM